MGNPPYKESIRPGDIKVFKISGSNGESVDISGSIGEFFYYESILSNTVTATVAFIDTGFEKEGNSRIKTTGIVDSLELVGGEKVEFEIVDSNDMSSESEGTIDSKIGDSDTMFIKTIRNVSTSTTKKVFILDLVSKEYWTNETRRVTKRYDGNPGDHVEDILKNILKVTVATDDIERSSYDYNFIGNTKKPLYTCTWLASKCCTSKTSSDNPKKGTLEGVSAGFFFFQTRDSYQFKSIDTLADQPVKPGRDFIYNNTGKEPVGGIGGKRVNILDYSTQQQTNIGKDLSLGVYNNKTIFFDVYRMYSPPPTNFSFDEDKAGKVKLLNERTNQAQKEITETPSRLMFSVLDVGTLPNGNVLVDDRENPSFTTRSPESMVQSVMRYNELFRTKINIIIPADFSIRAGDVVHCTFVNLNTDVSGGSETLSGNFVVANVCHKIDSEQTLSSLDIIRDSLGDID